MNRESYIITAEARRRRESEAFDLICLGVSVPRRLTADQETKSSDVFGQLRLAGGEDFAVE